MRIDSVNSFLSASPIVGRYPIAPVGKNPQSPQFPESTVSPARPHCYACNSISKAEARQTSKAPIVKISAKESDALQELINYAKTRTDILERYFPGLLRN